jgi:hypothetical protein
MTAALGADPELIGRPRHTRPGIAHVHLRTAALAADLKLNVAHVRDSSLCGGRIAEAIRSGMTRTLPVACPAHLWNRDLPRKHEDTKNTIQQISFASTNAGE